MMSLWDALRMNMMISYQELVRTFPKNYQSKKTHLSIMRSWANFHRCNLSASDGEFFLFDSNSD